MAKTPAVPKPTAAELNLLRVIWPLGASTVKQVHEAAQKERPEMTYATVLRLMQIMHGKGLLARDGGEKDALGALIGRKGEVSEGESEVDLVVLPPDVTAEQVTVPPEEPAPEETPVEE